VAFELQPTLTGDLLTLRPLKVDDFEMLFAVACDPLIWEQHPNHDRWKRDVFENFFRGAMESGGALVAIDRATGRVIGSSRYLAYDEGASEVEVGFTFLARSHWGGVYNREMKRLMLEHAFRFVNSVVFIIGPENHRSQKAVQKIGAALDGVCRNGAGEERVAYRLTKERFEAVFDSGKRE